MVLSLGSLLRTLDSLLWKVGVPSALVGVGWEWGVKSLVAGCLHKTQGPMNKKEVGWSDFPLYTLCRTRKIQVPFRP